MIMAQHEFLPLCDVLFNIISLAAYFCDIVFDVVMGYALFVHNQYDWFLVTMFFVTFSSIMQQIISAKWYLRDARSKSVQDDNKDIDTELLSVIKQPNVVFVLILHAAQLGVFWRYFKLFIPVDLRYVKYEVRDLCMLRLVHAFCESMPLLLIQLYLYWENHSSEFVDLNTVSVLLSLFSVCWALASFSKNVRKHNVHRLVLTWLGVIFQFFWRLGTVGARAISLVAYATLFKYWIFLVILLHWLSMLLWILSPKNLFHGERLSCSRKALFCAVIAFVYTFAYINLMEVNHREKMLMFYVVMGLENAMLMFVWIVGVSSGKPPWYRTVIPLTVFLMFCGGLGFMWLYYRYFHVRRLKYEAGGRLNNNNNATADNNVVNPPNSNSYVVNFKTKDDSGADKEIIRRHSFSGGYANLNDLAAYARMRNESNVSEDEIRAQKAHLTANHLGAIPGVFNCRFSNPYVAAMQKRKRKKPTSFVPPPSISQNTATHSDSSVEVRVNGSALLNGGYNSIPFWCRPLPGQYTQQEFCSENDCSSVGSRPDIHQKLLEKKQKQLAELKKIQEEIKLGKLSGEPEYMIGIHPPHRPPPPQDKKNPHYDTPEILLAPRYLNATASSTEENHYYDWSVPTDNAPVYRLLDEDSLALMYKTYRAASDLDSQLSLPRSYTLPREFKYYRKTKPRKPIRTEHFIPSTNSSDGDVDSGDDSDSTSSHTTSQPQPLKLPSNSMIRVKHETKL
ncbi:uncharacterized protein LOC135849652 [Planococcus citri]|uniref:uncharacterized protein LOC135849652 n=1 Tax=Planococcus citri TaxID=170843 RepID=UPI0031F7C141